MIINNPTGFYKSIIPPSVGNSGNYTYVISNNDPPRGSLFFFKINLRLASTSVPIISMPPTGSQYSGTLKSYRNISLSGNPVRPIGTVIEFNDSKNKLSDISPILNQSTDFSGFNDESTDSINSKLRNSYERFKNKLIITVQELQNSYVLVSNLEREFNTYSASLTAVEQALLLEPTDDDLLNVKNELNIKIGINNTKIKILHDLINKLSVDKTKYEDAIRSLVKVIQ